MTITNQTDYAGIKGALLQWTDGVLGSDKTRWENTDYPRLAKPYGTLLISTMGLDEGLDEVTAIESGGVLETTYTGNRLMVVRLRVYGDPPTALAGTFPMELLQTALMLLHAQSTIDDFRPLALAFISHGQLAEADIQEGDRWEWVAECDITFSYRTVLFDDGLGTPPDDGQWIETAPVTFQFATVGGVFTGDFSGEFS